MSIVQDHFNLVSTKYNSASNSGIWRFFRKQEAKGIQKTLPIVKPEMTALDLGCGAGFYSHFLNQSGFNKVTSVDFSKNMLAQLTGSQFVKVEADIENYLATEKYDFILCAGVLEFVKTPESVFKNVSKMLKPGASFVVLVPNKNFLSYFYGLYHRLHKIDVKIYDQTQLQAFAKKSGLKLVSTFTTFPFAKILKFS